MGPVRVHVDPVGPMGDWKEVLSRLRRRLVSIVLALDHHGAIHQASAMAFWLFLGLIPLAAILGWALARFAGAEIRQSIVASVVAVTPAPALALVDEQLRRLVESAETVAPLSLLGFLWISSGGVHTAIVAIQEAQTGHARAWWRNRLLAVVFVIVFLIVVTGSTTMLVLASPTFHEVVRGGYVEAGWMQVVRYSALPMSAVVGTLGAAVFFRLSSMRPDPSIRKRVWPGAMVSGLSWVAVSWGFSTYAKSIGRFPIFYGSLAAVALLMLWLWISSFLLLLGSEVNLQLEGTRKTMVPPSVRWLRRLQGVRTPPPPPVEDNPPPSSERLPDPPS